MIHDIMRRNSNAWHNLQSPDLEQDAVFCYSICSGERAFDILALLIVVNLLEHFTCRETREE